MFWVLLFFWGVHLMLGMFIDTMMYCGGVFGPLW